MNHGIEHRTFWERRLSSDWTESGVGYHALGRAFNTWMYRVREEVFQREVSRLDLDLPEARVLDVGSGTGHYVRCWQQARAGSITGCDLTEAAVERLRERFPGVRFLRTDIGAPNGAFGADTYDAVSCMDVLFHITDDTHYRRAIETLSAVVRPGGTLILSENFLRRAEQRGEHQVNRSLESISRVLADAGFCVERRVPMLVLMNAQVDAPYLWRKVWGGALRAVTVTEPTGWLAGAALYPLEQRLVRWFSESPTTEVMVCTRAG